MCTLYRLTVVDKLALAVPAQLQGTGSHCTCQHISSKLCVHIIPFSDNLFYVLKHITCCHEIIEEKVSTKTKMYLGRSG